jgi:hypothetical protein
MYNIAIWYICQPPGKTLFYEPERPSRATQPLLAVATRGLRPPGKPRLPLLGQRELPPFARRFNLRSLLDASGPKPPSDDASLVQPQEQVTSQRGFPVLVNGSWGSAASAATSHKPTSRPVALPRPLRVSLLPCLADGFLLGRGHRAVLERTDQEDSAQNG